MAVDKTQNQVSSLKKKKTLENNMKRRRLQTHVLNLTIVNSTISSQVDQRTGTWLPQPEVFKIP